MEISNRHPTDRLADPREQIRRLEEAEEAESPDLPAPLSRRSLGTMPDDLYASPHSRPPQITLNTPSGNSGPMISASRSVDSGACSGGLTTIVLPAISGAPIFIVANKNG